MKRFVSIILMIALLTTWMAPLSFAEENGVQLAENVKSAILIERDTGEILYEKNSKEQLPPASMTKIMTMLLIMEAFDKGKLTLDEKVRTSEYAASMGGSQIFLEPGEEMTSKKCCKELLLVQEMMRLLQWLKELQDLKKHLLK